MKTNETTADTRDEGRLFIALLLAVWVVFFALMTVGSVLSLAGATTALGTLGLCWCVVINGAMFVTGCRWVVQFVTGKA